MDSGILYKLVSVARAEGAAGVLRRVAYKIRTQKARAAFGINQGLKRPQVGSAYGVKLQAHYEDKTFRLYANGAYGYFYSSLIEQINEDFCFVDVGANQGLYSIIAAKNPRCQKVFAFEPVPNTADILSRNLAINGVAQKVSVVRKAISNTTGVAQIATRDDHSGVATMAAGNQSFVGQKLSIETLNQTGLDILLQGVNLPVYMKVDVEGHEEVVIREVLNSVLISQLQCIFYECDESWTSATNISKLLEARGFRLKKVGSGTHYDVLATRR